MQGFQLWRRGLQDLQGRRFVAGKEKTLPVDFTKRQAYFNPAQKGRSTCTVPLPLVTNQHGEEFLYKIHMYMFMAD
jgi:hypothetical protein